MIKHSKYSFCPEQPRLPLVIGVTGHRDLCTEDIPDLKKRLSAIFDNLQEEYSSTPLMLMTALADGADLLAAEVALDAGIGLVVSLPMSQELYEQDFSETSVKQFRILLNSADIVFTLPLEPDNTSDAVQSGGTARDRQYHAVGRCIVEHCQLLIGLWDGVTADKMGDTSQIVRMQLKGVDDFSSTVGSDLFAPLQTGTVIHLLTRRQGSSTPPDEENLKHHRSNRKELEGISFLYPRNDDYIASREEQEKRALAFSKEQKKLALAYREEQEKRALASSEEQEKRALASINRFNSDSIDIYRLASDFDAERQQSAEYVLPKSSDGAQDSFSQNELSSPSSQLLAHYAHTDALAQQFQKLTQDILFLLPCLIPFVVFFLGVYSNVTIATFAISGYLVTIALAYGIYILMQRQGVHAKFLDYRALAEGMRVSLFWRLAGIKETPASFYLSKQQSELDWIRYAIRIWNLLAFKGCDEKTTDRSMLAVKTHWLKDQMKYFGIKAQAHNQTAKQLDAVATFLFRLGLFVMTPAMLLVHGLKLGGESLDPWMMVITPLFFVVAGSINYYAYRMLFDDQAKQYTRMYGIFKKSLHLLDKASDDESRQQSIILAVGKEALAENGDWILVHRERPIEVPQG